MPATPAKTTTAKAVKVPQDHKPKAVEATGSHPFTVNGKRYVLPPISEDQALTIPADITMDAVENPENGLAQTRLIMATLRAAEPPDDVVAALRTLSTKDMMEIVGEWMNKGESEGSSAS